MGRLARDLTPHLSVDHHIGSQLRRLRTTSHLSQRQLAAEIHVSPDLIARIERGERRLSPQLAVDIDTVLDGQGSLPELVEARTRLTPMSGMARVTPLDPISVLSSDLAADDTGQAIQLARRALLRMADYPSHAPHALWLATQQDLVLADHLMRSTPTLAEHEAILRGLVVLTGTAGNLLTDLGDRTNARRYLTLSLEAARDLKDHALQAWALGMTAVDTLVAADWHAAAIILGHAYDLAATGPARRRAWLRSLRARAYAAVGDACNAYTSLTDAQTLLDDAEPPAELDFFDAPRLIGATGTTHLLLHDSAQADAVISQAISLRRPGDVKGIALLTLDQAECAIMAGQPDAAASRMLYAATLAQNHLVAPIRTRLQQVRSRLSQLPTSTVLLEIDDRLSDLLHPDGKV
jgi:transcriptional regulator with XRE-family HTH domain